MPNPESPSPPEEESTEVAPLPEDSTEEPVQPAPPPAQGEKERQDRRWQDLLQLARTSALLVSGETVEAEDNEVEDDIEAQAIKQVRALIAQCNNEDPLHLRETVVGLVAGLSPEDRSKLGEDASSLATREVREYEPLESKEDRAESAYADPGLAAMARLVRQAKQAAENRQGYVEAEALEEILSTIQQLLHTEEQGEDLLRSIDSNLREHGEQYDICSRLHSVLRGLGVISLEDPNSLHVELARIGGYLAVLEKEITEGPVEPTSWEKETSRLAEITNGNMRRVAYGFSLLSRVLDPETARFAQHLAAQLQESVRGCLPEAEQEQVPGFIDPDTLEPNPAAFIQLAEHIRELSVAPRQYLEAQLTATEEAIIQVLTGEGAALNIGDPDSLNDALKKAFEGGVKARSKPTAEIARPDAQFIWEPTRNAYETFRQAREAGDGLQTQQINKIFASIRAFLPETGVKLPRPGKGRQKSADSEELIRALQEGDQDEVDDLIAESEKGSRKRNYNLEDDVELLQFLEEKRTLLERTNQGRLVIDALSSIQPGEKPRGADRMIFLKERDSRQFTHPALRAVLLMTEHPDVSESSLAPLSQILAETASVLASRLNDQEEMIAPMFLSENIYEVTFNAAEIIQKLVDAPEYADSGKLKQIVDTLLAAIETSKYRDIDRAFAQLKREFGGARHTDQIRAAVIRDVMSEEGQEEIWDRVEAAPGFITRDRVEALLAADEINWSMVEQAAAPLAALSNPRLEHLLHEWAKEDTARGASEKPSSSLVQEYESSRTPAFIQEALKAVLGDAESVKKFLAALEPDAEAQILREALSVMPDAATRTSVDQGPHDQQRLLEMSQVLLSLWQSSVHGLNPRQQAELARVANVDQREAPARKVKRWFHSTIRSVLSREVESPADSEKPKWFTKPVSPEAAREPSSAKAPEKLTREQRLHIARREANRASMAKREEERQEALRDEIAIWQEVATQLTQAWPNLVEIQDSYGRVRFSNGDREAGRIFMDSIRGTDTRGWTVAQRVSPSKPAETYTCGQEPGSPLQPIRAQVARQRAEAKEAAIEQQQDEERYDVSWVDTLPLDVALQRLVEAHAALTLSSAATVEATADEKQRAYQHQVYARLVRRATLLASPAVIRALLLPDL